MRSRLLALLAGTAIAVTSASPAAAAPWDGQDFDFGYGTQWRLGTDFAIRDINLGTSLLGFTQPASSGEAADLWDVGLTMYVRSGTIGLDDDYACAHLDSDIDISMNDGDVVITCETNWGVLTDSDVRINGEIRIYGPEGDLVRYTLAIQNSTDADITDFVVRTNTDWGTSGDIWTYQNLDSEVLAVPANADDSNAEKLRAVDSNWVVNYSDEDAPGSLAWGNNSGSVDVGLWGTSGDNFDSETESFTVAAGETIYLAYFTGWDPASLIALSYEEEDYSADGDWDLAAAAVADAAAEFDSFSGRLTKGLPAGAKVINWGSIPADEGLAPTGTDPWAMWAGIIILAAGVTGRAVRRRVRS